MLPSGASTGNTSAKAACKPFSSRLDGVTSTCKKSLKEFFCMSSKSGKGSLVEILPKFVCFSIISKFFLLYRANRATHNTFRQYLYGT